MKKISKAIKKGVVRKYSVSSQDKQENKQEKKYMGIMPLADRVLLKPVSSEQLDKKTVSGIIIPDTVSNEKPEQGTIVAVGKGKVVDGLEVPMSVKVGQRVVFSRYGFDEIKYEGEEYYIVKEDNILAILD